MHTHETRTAASTNPDDVDGVLNFLWLELTNRCNLQCVHCYTESGPTTGSHDKLTGDQYADLMVAAHDLGCRKIQFIGGEPQLNPEFKRLLRFSGDLGFEFVEVFSNLTRLDDETLDLAARNRVHFATSVYSDEAVKHDAVTTVRGSHRRTITNLRRLIDRGVRTRTAVLDVNDDPEAAERTGEFLRDLGTDIGTGRSGEIREFGRGQAIVGRQESMDGLCGHCWNGSLAVAPDGAVMPCVMARQWAVGNVLEQPLAELLQGDKLRNTRRQIHDRVWVPKVHASCTPYCFQSCQPDLSCPCDPLLCQQSCAPWDAQIVAE